MNEGIAQRLNRIRREGRKYGLYRGDFARDHREAQMGTAALGVNTITAQRIADRLERVIAKAKGEA